MKYRLHLSLLLLAVCLLVQAQSFNKATYYKQADGMKGQALKTALCNIINSHTALSYDNLWTAFKTTDKRDDGKVWDMYSSTSNFTFGTDQAGSYSDEGDKYNREHSFPKSWFNDDTPMYTDLYHLYPTDGYVNGQRSNFCFGEVGKVTYESNGGFSKKGTPSATLKADGCSESYVFEPNDIYKGDFARTYFYMVTCYENRVTGWSCGMLSGNKYPAFTTWAKNMLLDWAKADQVSEKETDRIEAVYSYQKNRNPFIDYPGLEEYIWGDWQNVAFSVSNYVNPYTADVPTEPSDTTKTDTTVVTPEDPDEPVEAGETIFYESFDDCAGTGGNDGKWTGGIASATTTTDNAGWAFTSGYGGDGCVRMGTGSKKGSATTPKLGYTGSFVLTFNAAAWGTDNDSLNVTVSGGGSLNVAGVHLQQSAFSTYTLYLTNATNDTQITFIAPETKNNRFFLDEVKICTAKETGVSSVSSSVNDGRIYSLSGMVMPVGNNQRGIIIKNGRKILK